MCLTIVLYVPIVFQFYARKIRGSKSGLASHSHILTFSHFHIFTFAHSLPPTLIPHPVHSRNHHLSQWYNLVIDGQGRIDH
jgi:hypothetical protein